METQTCFLFLSSSLIISSFSLLLSFSCNAQSSPLKICNFNAIYQLGDSISDAGNLIRESPFGAGFPFAHLPYGQTTHSLFNTSTGRCSNGLLIIDFLARAAGLPLVDPYLGRDSSFSHGVNFAVAGSTALSSQVLAQKGIVSPVTNSSLLIQLQWMRTHFGVTYQSHQDCVKAHNAALFVVGEIGGNDYNYALLGGKTIEEAECIVPQVIENIKYAVRVAIHYGAQRVIVPGNFPIGCLPIYLTAFRTNDSYAYDELHCLKGLNELAAYHNDHLRRAIEELRQEHPDVIIVYGDYYNAFLFLYRFALSPSGRFDVASVQKACCGIGGEHDFSLTRMCGSRGVPVCRYPQTRISWDGVHMTERAYFIMARWLVSDILPPLQCSA